MLIYELNCETGHAFEGWFDSLDDLESQLAMGAISCPLCGNRKVRKVPSAFAISKKAAYQPSEVAHADQHQAAAAVERALQNFFIKNFEDVGANFFSEALKIHYGATPARNIRGISTSQEEDVLRREGVDFFKFNQESPQTAPKPEKPDKPSH